MQISSVVNDIKLLITQVLTPPENNATSQLENPPSTNQQFTSNSNFEANVKEVSPISNKNKAETSWRGASSEVPSVFFFSCTECQWLPVCSTVDSDNMNVSNHLENVFVGDK